MIGDFGRGLWRYSKTSGTVRKRALLAVEVLERRELLAYGVATLSAFDVNLTGAGLTVSAQGDVYGTTVAGGANGNGEVFEIVNGSNAITVLASFDAADGNGPNGVAVDAQGNVFGTTVSGGADRDGIVFEVVKGSGTVTPLATFQGATGMFPTGAILDADGNLFGTTSAGGANGVGTVFELAHGATTVTPLASFAGNDLVPSGLVLDPAGDLFGTTSNGGASNLGTVFEVASGSNTITTLASFNGSNGASPATGVVLDASGDLFGATPSGGANLAGTVFELGKGSAVIVPLASFNAPPPGQFGGTPLGVAVDPQGNLFGTTAGFVTPIGKGVQVRSGPGMVFELAHGSNQVTPLAAIDTLNGVALDAQGNLYGTTIAGGVNGGTVVRFSPNSPTVAPTIVSASPIEKSAGIGHRRPPTLKKITLVFNEALNPSSARARRNYHVSAVAGTGRKATSRPVAFRVAYDPATNSVSLTFTGNSQFRRGGQVVLRANGIVDSAGRSLQGPTVLTVLPQAQAIVF